MVFFRGYGTAGKKQSGAEVRLQNCVLGGGNALDINILLSLQELRNGPGACLVSFMLKMSYLSEMSTVLIIAALIYWCVSKDFGSYLLMGFNGSRVVNGFLKVTACAYRPWIRDARIIPDSEAIKTATGYSFPSGHSTNAGAVYGGGAIRAELPKALRITLGAIVVLVVLSRIFLGVHTPQDILVGMCSGLLVMWLTGRLMAWVDRHPGKDILVMCVGIGAAVAVAVFAAVKSYPADYDAAGNLLVDGAKMAADTFKGVGWCVGFLSGWVLERRFIGFSTDVPMMTRMTRLTIGLLGYYAVSLILSNLLKSWIPGPAGTIISCFIQMFYVTFLFPWCIKHCSAFRHPYAGKR